MIGVQTACHSELQGISIGLHLFADHIRNFVEPLLSEYGVDLVLSGHIHAYARTCEVFEEQCVKHERLGVVHVTLGSCLSQVHKALFADFQLRPSSGNGGAPEVCSS